MAFHPARSAHGGGKLTPQSEDRVPPVDAAVAERWGRFIAEAGRSVPAVDGLLAATALHHELRPVTPNAEDFDLPGLEVVNPWLP